MSSPLLTVKDLHVHYGAIHAVKGPSFTVNPGEILAIIGSNGAGKTTTLGVLCGLLSPSKGEIIFKECPIHKLPAHKVRALGICTAPEGRLIFPRLTVNENLTMGAYLRPYKGETQKDIERDREEMFELFPRLKERIKQKGGTLSGGEQQMLAIARACMGRPSLLLLDEPSLGLAPILVKTIFQSIRQINRRGTAVILVEQNARAALRIAHRALVLSVGETFLSGRADEILNDERIQKAYLGG